MKKFNLSNRLKALCFSVIICLFSVAANAAVINFNSLTGTNAGTVNYDGTVTGLLAGINIDIGEVSGTDTADNSGLNDICIGCQLNFATGAFNAGASTGSHYVFDAGGFFEITGTVAKTGGGFIVGLGDQSTDPLLSGIWTSQITVDITGGIIAVSQGSGTDTKNIDLLNYFGETASNFTFANANIQLADLLNPILPGAGFSTTVTQAIVSNVATVPLPGAVWLMGSGLIGLLGVSRRRV